MDVDQYGSIVLMIVGLAFAVWLSGVLGILLTLSRARIRKLDPQKRKTLIVKAELWLQQRYRFSLLVRLLFWVSLSVLAILGNHVFRNVFDLSENLYTGILCGVVLALVFGLAAEVVGSGWLASHTWGLISLSTPLIRFLHFILYPVIAPASALQRHLLRSSQEGEEDEATTEDEIMSLVEQDAHQDKENGMLEASERRMIRGIFYLDETLVKEIMTPRVDVKALPSSASVADLKQMIMATGHSRIPVYRDSVDEVIGVVYAKDLLDDARQADLGSILEIAHDAVFVPETKGVRELLEEFKATHVQIAVIIDEYGGTAGVVTIEDILEEIVGEIIDEYDVHEREPEYHFNDDGSLAVDARTPIEVVNEMLGLSLPEEEEYDTIGGYVSAELGRIPKAKESLQVNGLQVLILAGDDRKIDRLSLRRLGPPSDEESDD